MNMPIPDVSKMTAEQFVMWGCAILLGFVLYMNPGALVGKVDRILEVQAQMITEHHDLLRVSQVQCVNWAEMVGDKEMRARHLRRCLTLQVNTEVNS